jgi:hypothetical protein
VSRSTRDDEERAGQRKGSGPELAMVIVSQWCARARVGSGWTGVQTG